MPDFDNNNLSQEELTSGIQHDTERDETFELESMEEYPGEIPDSVLPVQDGENLPDEAEWKKTGEEIKSEEIPEPISKEGVGVGKPVPYEKSGILPEEETEIYGTVKEAELIESPSSGTVWDMFEKEDEQQGQHIVDKNLSEEKSGIDLSKSAPTEKLEGTLRTTTDDEIIAPAADDVVVKIAGLNELEPVQIDEDLKNLIQSDLEKSKEQIQDQKIEEPINESSESEISKQEKFEISEINESEEQVIDLGAIEADKPSTYGLDAGVMEEVAEEELSEGMHIALPKRKPAVKPDETGEIKERKKLNIPLKYIGIAAALLLILSAATIGVYKLFIEKGDKQIAAIDKSSIKEKKPKDVEKKKEIVEDTTKKAEVKPDTIKPAAPEKKAVAFKDSVSKIRKEDKRFQFVETEKKKPEIKSIATRPEKTKPIITAEKLPETKVEETQQVLKPETEKLYVVQVYSTPSKTDAEDWLTRLTNKNIQNAFISEQKIRDKIWYRVRFGNFKSRDEAMQEAMKYGFAQTWIDRIK